MSFFKSLTPSALIAGLLATLAAPAPAEAQQAYAYNNVFDDDTDLTLNGLWAVDNTPAVANSAPGTSGGNNLNYNNGSDYAGDNSGTARTPTIDMTGADANSTTMTFWCRYQTETTGTSYDQRWIRIYNATNNSPVYEQQFAGTAAAPLTCPSMSTWHQHTWSTFPSNAVGFPIFIEFFFDTIDSVGNNYQGWFIDDLQILTNDSTPPAVIADLGAANPTLSSVDVDWTSPFDDDLGGQAQSFDLRYATTAITEQNFANATQVSGEPAPSTPGTPHSVTINGLNPGTQYWIAIRSVDPAGNVSGISNVETVTTLALPPVGGSATVGAKPEKDRYNACAAGTEAAPMGLMALGILVAFAAAGRAMFRK